MNGPDTLVNPPSYPEDIPQDSYERTIRRRIAEVLSHLAKSAAQGKVHLTVLLGHELAILEARLDSARRLR